MPPPRTPSNVLELRGTFKKDPKRRRKVAKPVDLPLGSPPAHLSPQQVDVWHEIQRIAPPNVLKMTDRMSLELFSCLMTEFRMDPIAFSSARVAQLMALFARFGMTPADREKISLDQGEITPPKYAEFG